MSDQSTPRSACSKEQFITNPHVDSALEATDHHNSVIPQIHSYTNEPFHENACTIEMSDVQTATTTNQTLVHGGFATHPNHFGPRQITRTGSYLFVNEEADSRQLAKKLYGMSQNEYAAHRRSRVKHASNTFYFCGRQQTIDPGSPARMKWDGAAAILVLYSLFTVPFQLAYYDIQHTKSALFYIGILIDLFFVVDLYLNCITGYWNKDDELVMDVRQTLRHYLKTSFVVDFLSVLPIDYLASGSGSKDDLASFTGLRALRLLRLLRLLRVFRIFRYLNKFLSDVSTTYMRIGKLVTMFLIFIHIDACMLFLIPRLKGFPSDSWVVMNQLEHASAGSQYVWSLFSATSQALCIGYGQYAPSRTDEAFMTWLSMLIGASLFAGIIGAVTALMLNRDNSGATFRKYKEEIELYMRDHKLAHPLKQRIRHFISQRWALNRKFDETAIIKSLPRPLRRAVQFHNCESVVRSVPLLVDANEGFLQAFVARLSVELVLENETIIVENEPASRLYMIGAGECFLFHGIAKVLTLAEGSFFGELALLWNIREPFTIRTQTDAYLYSMSKQDFDELMSAFPDAKEVMRKVAHQRLQKIQLEHVLHDNLQSNRHRGAFDVESKLNRLNTFFKEVGRMPPETVSSVQHDESNETVLPSNISHVNITSRRSNSRASLPAQFQPNADEQV